MALVLSIGTEAQPIYIRNYHLSVAAMARLNYHLSVATMARLNYHLSVVTMARSDVDWLVNTRKPNIFLRLI